MKRKTLELMIWSAIAAASSPAMTAPSGSNVGIEEWRVTEDSGDSAGYDKHDYGWGVTFDNQGNIISVGQMDSAQTGTSANDDAYIVKYDATGNKLWEKQYDDGDVTNTNCQSYKCDSRDILYDVAVDSSDNILMCGQWSGNYADPNERYIFAYWVKSISADGNTDNWEDLQHYDAWNQCRGVALDSNDYAHTSGYSFHSWSSLAQGDWLLGRYNTTGEMQSNYPIFFSQSGDYWLTDHSFGTAVDGDGYHYAVGRVGISGSSGGTTNNWDWHVRKINPNDGTTLWSDTLDGNNLYDQAKKIAVDSNNDVYVVGSFNMGTDNTADNQDYDWVIVKYSGAGDGAGGAVRQWTRTISGATGMNAEGQDIAWDSVNNTLIVVGYIANETSGNNEMHILRLDADTGETIREQLISFGNPAVPTNVALRGEEIAITGYAGNGSDYDVVTLKMTAVRPGVHITPDTGLQTTEAGGTATFDFNLTSAPIEDVTVFLASSNNGEGTVSPASLTFTPTNWATPQTVTLTGEEDSIDDGDQNYAIQFSVVSTDKLYDEFVIADLTVTNVDNDPIFADVPIGYWAYDWIQSLVDSGITTGCGGNDYCPTADVSRAQMAVFLERGIHGSDYTPPDATGTVFGDVPDSYWAANWIEALYADGITGGCGGGNYCPENSVNRAEMAIFLLRAEHGSSYQPPAATGTMFDDVPDTHWAAAWIEQLATEGITSGCDASHYCPDASVTRDAMAVFLTRTFNL